MTDSTAVAVRPVRDQLALAQELSNAQLLPRQYQRNPGNLLYAIQYAEALGIHPIAAITGIHVIEGKPTASAQLIGGLVRRAGHKLRVTFDRNTSTATARIVRADDPDFVFESVWSLDRARAAGLANKPVWKQYPDAMLKARAITEVARDACPEALYGVIYTPEELGAEVTADGDGDFVPTVTEALVPAGVAKTQLIEAAGGDRDIAVSIWGERGSASVTRSDLDEMLERAAALAVTEAELVDDDVLADTEALDLGEVA